MNKDVIYIESEDDITDIINKIEKSKSKIVALVPPKKSSVLRSIVNIKLITKAGTTAGKNIVLVTTDPSIMKLAAATKLPVTKNLQSAPTVPEATDEDLEVTSEEEIIEAITKDGEKEIVAEEVEAEAEAEEPEDDEAEEETDKKSDKKKAGKDKKKGEAKNLSKNPAIAWMQQHKKLLIGCGIGGLILILLLVWAFVIAPAATVILDIRTTSSNFSESVSFTDALTEENADEGKFYMEKKESASKSEVEFTATGTKNIGEKATGSVVILAYFDIKGSVTIGSGASFTLGDLTYFANEDATIAWDGKLTSCENASEIVEISNFKCRLSARIGVTASGPGTSYNIAPSSTGWSSSVRGIAAYSDQAMEGGTDKMITTVQQSDVDDAVSKLETDSESTSKEKLYETISEDSFIIEASFHQTVGDVVSTPAVGEEVKEGEKAKLSVTTTGSVYVVDKTKVEEFITAKAKLADNYKIYSMSDPFIENFMKVDGVYIGKLKTAYISGPKITENDVVETVRGKGLGSAQHDLKDSFSGISSITINPSFPWVTSIPNDPDRITVIMNVEE